MKGEIRERAVREVMRVFDLQDLLPVERQMIDTVIDVTVEQVVAAVREFRSDVYPVGDRVADYIEAGCAREDR